MPSGVTSIKVRMKEDKDILKICLAQLGDRTNITDTAE